MLLSNDTTACGPSVCALSTLLIYLTALTAVQQFSLKYHLLHECLVVLSPVRPVTNALIL